MSDNTLIWCTESVDNSAMFLSQAIDATMTKKTFEDVEQDIEMVSALQDPDSSIVFYGLVKMPDWFTSEFYDESRMYNDPRKCRKLLDRASVMAKLRYSGIKAVYYVTTYDRTWTSVRNLLHTSNVDLVKANGTVLANVSSSAEYNSAAGSAKYACAHIEVVGKSRVYIGRDHLVNDGVVCFTSTQKKKLSYKETLMLNQSSDVKAAIEGMFDDGLIQEDATKGIEAWSEAKTVKVTGEDKYEPFFASVSDKLISIYDIDFCAVDIVLLADGSFMVTNVTSCPSVQETEVLEHTSTYFAELVEMGRKSTKDKLVDIVSGLAEDDVLALAQFLKGMNKLTKTA